MIQHPALAGPEVVPLNRTFDDSLPPRKSIRVSSFASETSSTHEIPPQNIRLAESTGVFGKSIFDTRPRGNGALGITMLAEEVASAKGNKSERKCRAHWDQRN